MSTKKDEPQEIQAIAPESSAAASDIIDMSELRASMSAETVELPPSLEELADQLETEVIGELALEAAANEWKPEVLPEVINEEPIEMLEPMAELIAEIAAPVSLDAAAETTEITFDVAANNVAFIADPYGLPQLEVALAQELSEYVVINDDEDETDEETDSEELPVEDLEMAAATALAADETLENLRTAMAVEEDKQIQALEALAPEQAQAAAELLAQQISEDLALAQVMAAEAAQDEYEKEALDAELMSALPDMPVADEDGNLDLAEMESCLEALLFMSDKPVSVPKLRELLGPEMPLSIFQEAMTSLRDRYKKTHHGIEIAEVGGGFQLRTKIGRAPLARKLAKVMTQRLSTGAMESLAIIAYRQPALKDDIDKVRGVDSSHFIRGLLDKKLIKISGRSELPGRPMLYSTTQEFLELFGLKDLTSMPSLRELEQMIPSSQSKNPDDEMDPRVIEMRRLVQEMKADGSTNLNYDPREDDQFLKDIRDRVNAIQTSTATLDEQKAQEKAALLGESAVQ